MQMLIVVTCYRKRHWREPVALRIGCLRLVSVRGWPPILDPCSGTYSCGQGISLTAFLFIIHKNGLHPCRAVISLLSPDVVPDTLLLASHHLILKQPHKVSLFASPFYRWRSWGQEGFMHLLKTTQAVKARAGAIPACPAPVHLRTELYSVRIKLWCKERFGHSASDRAGTQVIVFIFINSDDAGEIYT